MPTGQKPPRNKPPEPRRKTELVVDAETSARLGRVRQKGTTPELAVRSVLRLLGAHYRTSNRDLPGSPDVANRAGRWAIFVHGCFWHRHTGCRRTTTPSRNRDFWLAKFAGNVARDARAIASLEAMGFSVLVLWECETTDPAALQARLRAFVGQAKDRRS